MGYKENVTLHSITNSSRTSVNPRRMLKVVSIVSELAQRVQMERTNKVSNTLDVVNYYAEVDGPWLIHKRFALELGVK